MNIVFFTYSALFIIGLAVGSFLNVLSLRYGPGEKFFSRKNAGGRSACPHCGKELQWFELIPVLSFVLQRGRCRTCGKRLSFQYPLVEILTGLIFVLVPAGLTKSFEFWSVSYQPSFVSFYFLTSLIWIAVFILLLLLSIIDFREFVIPDQINLALALMGLILFGFSVGYRQFSPVSSRFLGAYALIFGLRDNFWINYIVAGLLGGAIFGFIILLSRGRAMGWGDAKLAAALGLIFGWPEIALVIALAFIVGAIFGIFAVIKGRKTLKDAVPFGPFLVLGAALVFFFGHQILEVYFKLFSIS